LVYTSGGSTATNSTWWVNRDGSGTPIDTSWHVQGSITSVALSPNAKSLAVTVLRGAAQDVWVKQLPTGPFSRLTFGDTAHFRGEWTGDGRSVVYIADLGSGAGDAVLRRADGTGAPQVLVHAKGTTFGQVVPTKDGRWLVLRRSTAEAGGGDLYAVKMGDTAMVPLVTGPARELSPAVSPDGRWLAYSSDESGAAEIYVRPFPDVATARWQVSANGGINPVWARNGQELFYINGRGEMASVALKPGATFTPGDPRALFSVSQFTVNGNAGVFDVSPDGKRFLMVRPVAGLGETELVVVQNWFEELKQRAK
jgi:Tol biopolymer transport system component